MLTSKRSALFNEHRYRNTGDVDLSKRDDCTTRQTCCETGTQSRESFAACSPVKGTIEPRKTVWLPKRSEKADFSVRRSAQTKRDLALVVTHHSSFLRRSIFLTINFGSRPNGPHVSADPRSAKCRLLFASLMDQFVRQTFQYCAARS